MSGEAVAGMGERTYATLNDAIQAHVQDNQESNDFILTDWVVYSYSTSMSRSHTGVYQRASSNMPPHHLMGLIDRMQRTASEEDDEPDEE